jgi:hypothetical protein
LSANIAVSRYPVLHNERELQTSKIAYEYAYYEARRELENLHPLIMAAMRLGQSVGRIVADTGLQETVPPSKIHDFIIHTGLGVMQQVI